MCLGWTLANEDWVTPKRSLPHLWVYSHCGPTPLTRRHDNTHPPPSQVVGLDQGEFCPLLFVCLFWPCHVACGILVPRPGMEPIPPAVEVRSLNHWTAREVPVCFLIEVQYLHYIQ